MTSGLHENKADAILIKLRESARHPKTVAAAERIKNGCDYLSSHKIHISAPEVAQLCSEKGPKLQSLHNNKMFKAYILARASEQKLHVSPKARNERYEIADPEIRAFVYAVEVDARRERQQRENLTRALSESGEWDLDATIASGKLVPKTGVSNSVPPDVCAALRKILDPGHLRKFDLHHMHGRIIATNRNNRVFMEKADLEVIAAAAGFTVSEG
jgi:hypothetical protein